MESLTYALTTTHQLHPIIMDPVHNPLRSLFQFFCNIIFPTTSRSAKWFYNPSFLDYNSVSSTPFQIPQWSAKLNLLVDLLNITNYLPLNSNFLILPKVTFS